MPNRDILSLDFYGEGVTAALACQDETTDTLRIRHILRYPSKAFAGAFVRERSGAQDDLSRVFEEISRYITSSPSVIVGVRGNFLSFAHSTGFTYTQSSRHIIHQSDIDNAIQASLPTHLDESLEVVDILPLSYIIDDQAGATDPKGMNGSCLGAETFISLGVGTHLANLSSVLSACGCEDYLWLPSSVALGETSLTPAEKASSCLLVDLGENSISALLYHKDSLLDGWELNFGLDRVAENVADQLQNDVPTALQILRTYDPDPVMDDVLEEAAAGLVDALHKELVQSLPYIQHPPTQLVLCGQGAWPVMLKLLKNKLSVRKTRLCSFDNLIADCDIEHPQYDGVLALLQHALAREKNQLGVAKVKEEGFLGKLFTKLGFN